MGLEIEAKIKVDSHDAVRARLKELGATYIGTVRETNRILDNSKNRLRKAGCGLRVRQVEVLDGDPGPSSITYKGPRRQAEFKVREEINIDIADADGAASIFEALGFEPFITFEKIRETWQLGACRVELDELPMLDTFIEIEGPTEADVTTAKSDLGFASAETITQSYIHMLRIVCQASGVSPDHIRFQ